WRRLTARSFRGSQCRDRMGNAQETGRKDRHRKPSAHPGPNDRAAYVTIGRDRLFRKRKTITVAALEAGVPALLAARTHRSSRCDCFAWSNGQTEGQITQARIMAAANSTCFTRD